MMVEALPLTQGWSLAGSVGVCALPLQYSQRVPVSASESLAGSRKCEAGRWATAKHRVLVSPADRIRCGCACVASWRAWQTCGWGMPSRTFIPPSWELLWAQPASPS